MTALQPAIKKYALVLIAAIGLLAYVNSFNNSFQFDDGYHIVEGDKIKNFDKYLTLDHWKQINDRPLSFFTLAINYRLGELEVAGYHVMNLLFHVLAGFVAFLLTLQILSLEVFKKNKTVRDYGVLIALFSAFIFVAHPIQTQAVTYIIQRMTVLAGLFYMLSVLFYIKGRVAHLDAKETKAWKPWAFYAGAVIAGGLGFLSKQNAATFPLAFILAEILFIRNAEGRHDRKFLIILSSVIGGLLILGISIAGIPSEYEKISRSEYLYTQFRVLVKYWQLLFLPVNQHLDYYWRVSNTLWGWKELTSLAFLLVTLAAAVLLFRKNWIIPAFAIFWFYLTLSIESTIIPIRDVIFEHRLYMAVYGFGFAISYLAFYFLGKKKALVPALVLGAITLAYAGAAINRNNVWKTPYTLWTDSTEKSPKRERAWYWLASYYTSERDPQNALRCYETSIQCNPNFPLAYNGRGNIRKESGDLDGALTDYSRAIELDPNYVTAYYNRGIALAAKNKLTDAIKDYDRSVSLGNSSSAVFYNRANAKRRKGLYDSAIEDYNKAISIDPRYPLAFFNRGLTKSAKKNQEGAIKDIDMAISLDPNNHLFYNGKGVSYMNMGKYEDAVKEFDRSVQLNPGFGQAFYNRGYAKFNGLGDLSGACADWNKALQLDYRQARRYLDQYCK